MVERPRKVVLDIIIERFFLSLSVFLAFIDFSIGAHSLCASFTLGAIKSKSRSKAIHIVVQEICICRSKCAAPSMLLCEWKKETCKNSTQEPSNEKKNNLHLMATAPHIKSQTELVDYSILSNVYYVERHII